MLKFASKLHRLVLKLYREGSTTSEQREQLHQEHTREVSICQKSHRHQGLETSQARHHLRWRGLKAFYEVEQSGLWKTCKKKEVNWLNKPQQSEQTDAKF